MKKLRMLTVILSFVFALRSVSYANAVDIENPSPNKDETVAVTFHCGKGEFVDIDEKTFVKDVKVGKRIGFLPKVELEHHRFIGWYNSKSKKKITKKTRVKKTITCYAFYKMKKEYRIFVLVNKERDKADVHLLKWDENLEEAANIRAKEIASYFSHTRPDGTSCFTVSHHVSGENIAAGQIGTKSVMKAWMNSESHKENILRKGYEGMAVGHYYKNGKHYWVQLFSH